MNLLFFSWQMRAGWRFRGKNFDAEEVGLTLPSVFVCCASCIVRFGKEGLDRPHQITHIK